MERSQLNPSGAPESSGTDISAAKAQEILYWLDPLLKNEHFQKFLSQMKEGVRELHDLALDVSTPPDERDRNAQRHFVLQKWATYPEQQHANCVKVIRDAERIRNQEREAEERQEKLLEEARRSSSYFDTPTSLT